MPVWMMAPLKVSRSTMAAQSRGSVNVFVHPLNDIETALAVTHITTPGDSDMVARHAADRLAASDDVVAVWLVPPLTCRAVTVPGRVLRQPTTDADSQAQTHPVTHSAPRVAYAIQQTPDRGTGREDGSA